nr:glycoside hydrolase family 3 N-terminal domain-containing protein [uncultured Acetatifactor sp.]
MFQAGINEGADMVMVSHMAASALTGDNEPSIFSQTLVTGILREQMGFQGVIITDALDMGAISQYYAADEASIMAVLAGCDMLLMPEDYEKAYTGVLEAVRSGNIDEERINDSLRRIYRIKYADMVQ